MVGSGDRDDIDIFPCNHVAEISIDVGLDPFFGQFQLAPLEHSLIDIAQGYDSHSFETIEPHHMGPSATANPRDSDPDLVVFPASKSQRRSTQGQRGPCCYSRGYKGSSIHLHTGPLHYDLVIQPADDNTPTEGSQERISADNDPQEMAAPGGSEDDRLSKAAKTW
jgi:hypothetical protein